MSTNLLQKTLFRTTFCLVAATAAAQSPAPGEPTPAPERVAERAAEADVSKWIQQLGSDSYRARLEAENRLKQLGEQAREALEAAAAEPADSEVQWRAKRLLRQIGPERPGDRAPARALVERSGRQGRADGDRAEPEIVERRRGRSRSDQGRRGLGRLEREPGDIRAEFDRIFKRFEEMGLDVPSRRFFDEPFFKDLESQMGPGAFDRSGHSMSVQMGPDGVRVEVQEQGKDGKSETKVYEAPDMETFQKNHPGVLKGDGFSIGLKGLGGAPDSLRSRIGELERAFDWDMAVPRALRLPRAGGPAPSAAPPAGRRLGVTTKPIPEALRDYLELGAAGLMVESVQDGSLAAQCGLQADDIVVAIGDEEIRSAADVARALGAIEKGAEVRVDYVRRGQRAQAKATKQRDAAPAREALPPKDAKRARKERR